MLANFTFLGFKMIWSSPYKKIIYRVKFCTEVLALLKNGVKTARPAELEINLFLNTENDFGSNWMFYVILSERLNSMNQKWNFGIRNPISWRFSGTGIFKTTFDIPNAGDTKFGMDNTGGTWTLGAWRARVGR